MKNIYFLILAAFLIPAYAYGMEKSKAQEIPKKILIFDLGGIFFDLDGVKMGLENVGDGSKIIGAWKTIMYGLCDRENPFKQVEKRFFETLDQFPLKQPDGFKRACKSRGTEMPFALCAYQAGLITSEEILKMAQETCDKLKAQKFFVSDREEAILRNLIKGTFTPVAHSKFTYALTNAISLLKRIAALRNEDGTKRYRIIALSNWDRESFAFVRAMFAEEFSYFDDIIISGDIKTVKPNAAAFEAVLALLKKQGYSLEDCRDLCAFFDDQAENVTAGNAFFNSYLVKRGDAQSLLQVLMRLNVLPEVPAPFVSTTMVVAASLTAALSIATIYMLAYQ